MAKWCELLFPLYSVEFLNLSDDNNSHQSFPWVPLKAARFTEKHNGLLRHSNVQSNTSDTATVPISGTFKWWNSCLMNVRVRKVLVEEARLPSRYTGFDSVTGKKNSSVIRGHDGSTQRKEWRGRNWLVTRDDEVAYNSPPPYHSRQLMFFISTLLLWTFIWRNPLFEGMKNHFSMVSSKSASLNCHVWDTLKKQYWKNFFKNGFKADQYQPPFFSFTPLSLPSQLPSRLPGDPCLSTT